MFCNSHADNAVGCIGKEAYTSDKLRNRLGETSAHRRVEVRDHPVGDGLDVVLGAGGMQVAGRREGAVARQQQRHRQRHLPWTTLLTSLQGGNVPCTFWLDIAKS